MRIYGLEIENVQKIRAVELRLADGLVQITGRNAQGKSSLMNAIDWTLTGKGSHPPEPIRRGQRVARVKLDCGDLIVRRRWRKVPAKDGTDGETRVLTDLTVESTDGFKAQRPQDLLESIYNERCIDPTVFVRAKPAEQYEMLAELVGLDFSDDEAANRKDYDERRVINRQAGAARQAAGQIVVPDDAPEAPVDVDELNRRYRSAIAFNAERRELIHERDAKAREIDVAKAEAERLRAEARELERRAVDMDNAGVRLNQELRALPDVLDERDTSEIERAISTAQHRNRAYDARVKRDRLIEQAKTHEAESKALTDRMAARDDRIAKAIEAADMPVDGLALADGRVTYGGLPFEQAATSEQYDVSAAIAIRSAGKLRTLLIRSGNDLDSAALERIAKRAADEKFQVLIERVDESGKVGIVIEDGMVAAGDDRPRGHDGDAGRDEAAPSADSAG